MSLHTHQTAGLTKNQALVMETLGDSAGPMSAYSILDKLRDEGLRAPLQVYRALDKLVELGLVHRLESLNSFVACRQPDCNDHKTIAFMICETCGQVSEISDADLAGRLGKLARKNGFTLMTSTIELRGTCQACAS